MARIELRDCTILLKDGTAGSAVITTVAPSNTATTVNIGTVSMTYAANTSIVPIGARFTINTANNTTTYVVTGRTAGPYAGVNAKQSISLDATVNGAPNGGTFTLTYSGNTTANIAFNANTVTVKAELVALGYTANDWDVTGVAGAWVAEFDGALGETPQPLITGDGTNLTGGAGVVTTVTVATTQTGFVPVATGVTATLAFSPAWGTYYPAVNDVITFLPQELEIKIGEGNLTYTEHKDYKYMLDRGNLDAVREADEKPVDVKTDFVYEFVTTGTSEDVSPVDALKGTGGAVEWVSSATDKCEPYAVDVIIEHAPPCTTAQDETTTLPDFRYETLEFNLKDATIAVTGKCNTVEAIVVRV